MRAIGSTGKPLFQTCPEPQRIFLRSGTSTWCPRGQLMPSMDFRENLQETVFPMEYGGFLNKIPKAPNHFLAIEPRFFDANSPDDLRIYHKNRIFPFWFHWFQITKVDNCRWWRQGDITVDLFQGEFFMCWPWELDGIEPVGTPHKVEHL